VTAAELDGVSVEAGAIPLWEDRKVHRVMAVIGEAVMARS